MRLGKPVCLVGMALLCGCGTMPKPKLAWNDKAWINRARAISSTERMPDSRGIPALIGRLDDKDEVVRMTANEELKERTGLDFGFMPWEDSPARARAVTRWKKWWEVQKAGLVKTARLP